MVASCRLSILNNEKGYLKRFYENYNQIQQNWKLKKVKKWKQQRGLIL